MKKSKRSEKEFLPRLYDEWFRMFYEAPQELVDELDSMVLILNQQLKDSYGSDPPHIQCLAVFVRQLAVLLTIEFYDRANNPFWRTTTGVVAATAAGSDRGTR